MPLAMTDSEDDFEKQQKAIRASLETANKKVDSEILEKVAKSKEEQKKDSKMRQILRMLFDEMIEQIEDDDMTVDEALDDFMKAAKAIEI